MATIPFGKNLKSAIFDISKALPKPSYAFSHGKVCRVCFTSATKHAEVQRLHRPLFLVCHNIVKRHFCFSISYVICLPFCFYFFSFSCETNLSSITSRCEVRSHYATLVYDCLSMNESGDNGTNVCCYQTSTTEGVKTFRM